MKKKIFFIVLALLTLFNISAIGTIVYNNYFSNKQPIPATDKYINTLKDSLQLSENQCSKMRECNMCFKDTCAYLSHKLKILRNQLIDYLKEDSIDNNKINIILQRINTLQSSLLREIVNNLLTHKEILSNEQRQKFFSMISNDTVTNNEACCLNKNNK
jgi:hypothetical protein